MTGVGGSVGIYGLENKIAVIIGVGGLGGPIAEGFSREGAQVVVADRDEEKAMALAARLKAASGARVLGRRVDVTAESDVEDLANQILGDFGRVDVLVNVFGITVRKPAEELSLEEWRRVVEVNLTGTFISCQVFGKAMINAGAGVIVNFSSVRGRYGSKLGQAEYSASKSGVDGLTRSLAVQWARYGIRVNAVAPTFVETELTRDALSNPEFRRSLCEGIPMGRIAVPEDIVEPVLFLASPGARFITGQVLYVDGGLTAHR